MVSAHPGYGWLAEDGSRAVPPEWHNSWATDDITAIDEVDSSTRTSSWNRTSTAGSATRRRKTHGVGRGFLWWLIWRFYSPCSHGNWSLSLEFLESCHLKPQLWLRMRASHHRTTHDKCCLDLNHCHHLSCQRPVNPHLEFMNGQRSTPRQANFAYLSWETDIFVRRNDVASKYLWMFEDNICICWTKRGFQGVSIFFGVPGGYQPQSSTDAGQWRRKWGVPQNSRLQNMIGVLKEYDTNKSISRTKMLKFHSHIQKWSMRVTDVPDGFSPA